MLNKFRQSVADWIAPAKRSLENPNVPLTAAGSIFESSPTPAGVMVSEERAFGLTTVYTCVGILADTIASLEGGIFRVEKSGKLTPANDQDSYNVVFGSPNEMMTPFIFRQTAMGHAGLWGNSYSLLDTTKGGKVLAAFPLYPWSVEPRIKNRKLVYKSHLPDGSTEDLPPDEVLHIPALSFNGIIGMSPVRAMRNALGLALAAEEFGSRFFANDARPGIILEVPGALSEGAQKQLKDSVEQAHAGLSKKFKIMVAEAGLKVHEVGLPPVDAQFIETRNLQQAEIANMYRIPLHMVNAAQRGLAYASVEHFDIQFTKHTIRPWVIRWQQELSRKLHPRGDYVVRFDLAPLLRGDFKTQMEGTQLAVGGPFISIAEAREQYGLDPTGEDEHKKILRPVNMTTQTSQEQAKASAKPAASEPGSAPANEPKQEPATDE